MISILVWFAVLSSGSALCTVVWKRKYEEILPITCSVIVLVLFLCGILGNLSAGGALVSFLAGTAYLVTGTWVVKKREWRSFARNFFTPAFVGFALVILCVCFCNYGRVAYNWDEFSHWADTVKVMVTLDDFGTNPESYALFPNYPPGMALFQYYLQKLNQWFHYETFTEWQLYVAYQGFFFALMMPFLANLKIKEPIGLLFSLFLFLLCPLLFFPGIYDMIYIDPFLSVLSGTGLAAIYLCKKRDVVSLLHISLIIVMLVLSKDAGLFFAIFLALAYVVDAFHASGYLLKGKGGRVPYKLWFETLIVVLAVAIPKLLWNFELKTAGIKSLTTAYDLDNVKSVILGQNIGWQSVVWKNYFRKLMEEGIVLGNTNIVINYCALAFLLVGLTAVLCLFYEKTDSCYCWRGKLLIWCVGIQLLVYVIGLGITYFSRFSEQEGMVYASFERYIGVVYLMAWIVFVILFVQKWQEGTKTTYATEILAVFIVLSISPLKKMADFLCGDYVYNSLAMRAPFQRMEHEIEQLQEASCIYFVAEDGTPYEALEAKFIARPHVMNSDGWRILPFSDGAAYTKVITAEEWDAELKEAYDYVFLYQINDEFVKNYGLLFETGDSIMDGLLYQVNKRTGKLEICDGKG